MADKNPIGEATASDIVALRDPWHTKDHPFFIEFHEGKIGLDALGALMVQYYQHVDRVMPSLGIAIFKATGGARKFMIDTLAEERKACSAAITASARRRTTWS